MANSTAVSPGNPSVTIKNDGGTSGGLDLTAFALVPVFFLLGLTGVVICHVLKRKGYRCTTEAEDTDKPEEHECEALDKDLEMGELNDTFSENNDTVGHIVHYIMRNEANSDALKAMIHENSIDSTDGPPGTPTSPTSPTPPLTPLSPGAPPGAPKHTCSHLHTIGGMAGNKNICTRCSQKKWPLMRKPSARKSAEQRRSHCGEVTVLAVGRFRVTKTVGDKPARRTLLISDSAPTSPTEAEPKSRTASEAEPKSRTASEAEPKSQTASEAEAKSQTASEAEPKSRTASEAEPKSQTASEAEPKSQTASEAEAKSRTASEAEPKSQTASEAEAKSRTMSESQQPQTDHMGKDKL